MMSEKCGICRRDAKDDMIPCSGLCKEVYHLECANVTKTVFNNMMKNTQLRFYCKECGKINTVAVVRRIDLLTETMKSLVAQFAVLSAQFSELPALITSTLSTSVAATSCPVTNTPSTSYAGSQHLTIQGTGVLSNGIRAANAPSKSTIYVGRVHPSTTKEEMNAHVAEHLNLSLNDVDCFPLIPRGKDVSRLAFVSFKVIVPSSNKDEVMNPELWPVGAILHEFIQKPRAQGFSIAGKLPHSKND